LVVILRDSKESKVFLGIKVKRFGTKITGSKYWHGKCFRVVFDILVLENVLENGYRFSFIEFSFKLFFKGGLEYKFTLTTILALVILKI
jgi:hypothetical protein